MLTMAQIILITQFTYMNSIATYIATQLISHVCMWTFKHVLKS